MFLKKALSSLLILTLLTAAAGCGSGGSTPQSDTAPQASSAAAADTDSGDSAAPASDGELSGEIVYSTWGSLDEKKVNEEIIAAFEAKHPGTKVTLEYIPEDYVAKIDTMFLGGNAPDVIYGHPHYFTGWASQGLIMDLTDRFEADKDLFGDAKFAQHMYESFKYDGKNVATINGHDTFLLYYNKDLFDAAGVAYPTDEWTWDDWLEAAKKLTNNESGGAKRYATVFGDFAPTWFPYIYSHGGNIFDSMDAPTKVVFNSPETVEALRFIHDAIQTHQVAPSYMSKDLISGSFETGQVAMDVEGSWAPAGRRHLEFNWDMANLPLTAGKERRTSAYYAGYCVNAQTKNPDLAYAFAKFFQEDEGQQILSQLGLITVINEEIAGSDENLKGEGFPDHHALRVTSIEYATNGYANLSNWEEMHKKGIKPYFDELVAGNITPEECAQSVQGELEKLLEQSK